jgi:hypothetical protein
MTRRPETKPHQRALARLLLSTVLLLPASCSSSDGEPAGDPHAAAPAAVAPAAAESIEPARPPRARSQAIGALGKHYRTRSLAVSHDLKRIAWVDQREERCRVVVDRVRGPWFARCTNPIFSPDGSTVVYYSSHKVEEVPKVHLIVGDQASKPELGNEGPVGFAPKSATWAAIAPLRGPERAPGAPTPAEPPPRRMLAFGPSGTLGEYHDTSNPVVSPDGAHVAFVSSDAQGVQRLVVDGKVVRDFGAPQVDFIPVMKSNKPTPHLEPETTVRYLSDGSLVGVALGENGWTVFHDGATWASHVGIRMSEDSGFEITSSPLLSRSAVMGGSLVTAAEAPVACWWERREGDAEHWQVTCNGKPIDEQVCNAASAGQPIVLSANGSVAMYVCQIVPEPSPDGQVDPRNLWVVVGGKKLGPHRFVWGLTLTPDAQHWAYAAAEDVQDTWFYEFDGKRFDGPWQHAFPATISPDAKSIAWAASEREDGQRVDLVRDGEIVTRGDVVMAPPRWADGKVEFALKRGRSVRRVTID